MDDLTERLRKRSARLKCSEEQIVAVYRKIQAKRPKPIPQLVKSMSIPRGESYVCPKCNVMVKSVNQNRHEGRCDGKRLRNGRIRKATKNLRRERKRWLAAGAKYPAYMKTKWWRLRRAVAVREAGGRCICGSPGPLNVHHKNYKRLWRELREDLEVRCRSCHAGVHDVAENPPWESGLADVDSHLSALADEVRACAAGR